MGFDREGAGIPRGYAIQARVNMETIGADGSVRPGGGTLTVYEAPNGPGVRTDGFGYAGYKTSSAFDSLLAKVIVHSPSPDFAAAAGRASRALSEFRLEGVSTNISFLHNILTHSDFAAGSVHTRWVDENVAVLAANGAHRQRFMEPAHPAASEAGFAGARVKSRDPLALFAHDAATKAEQAAAEMAAEAPH
jgi:pyruvate carboxylase